MRSFEQPEVSPENETDEIDILLEKLRKRATEQTEGEVPDEAVLEMVSQAYPLTDVLQDYPADFVAQEITDEFQEYGVSAEAVEGRVVIKRDGKQLFPPVA